MSNLFIPIRRYAYLLQWPAVVWLKRKSDSLKHFLPIDSTLMNTDYSLQNKELLNDYEIIDLVTHSSKCHPDIIAAYNRTIEPEDDYDYATRYIANCLGFDQFEKITSEHVFWLKSVVDDLIEKERFDKTLNLKIRRTDETA